MVLENFFQNFSFFALLVSMLFFWFQIAFFPASKVASVSSAPTDSPTTEGATTEGPLSSVSPSSPVPTELSVAGAKTLATQTSERKALLQWDLGNFGIFLSNLSLFFLLLMRWKNSGHFPLSNLYESLMFLSWACTFIHLLLKNGFLGGQLRSAPTFSFLSSKTSYKEADADQREQRRQNESQYWAIIGSITSPIALFTNAFATFSLPEEMQKMSPLVPALQSNWLMMHVTVMILSYAALILGSLLSIAFLILSGLSGVSLGGSLQFSSPEAKKAGWNSSFAWGRGPNRSTTKGLVSFKKPLFNRDDHRFAGVASSLPGTCIGAVGAGAPNPNSDSPSRGPSDIALRNEATRGEDPNSNATLGYVTVASGEGAPAPRTEAVLGQGPLTASLGAVGLRNVALRNEATLAKHGEGHRFFASEAKRSGANPNPTPVGLGSSPKAISLGPVDQTATLKENEPNKLLKILDNFSYRILGIGFPLLTVGILSGAVWANEAWGSYWSWDPKETWALLTWLVFAIYLHTRLIKGWQGEKPAIIASFGFIVVWICYLGVNLIGEGLHSYGWMKL